MMKRITALAFAATLFAAATAQAQVDIYMTGATAFRANAFRSITNLYGANPFQQNPNTATASSSNRITWSGVMPGLFSGQTVTVRANYSGSIEGIQSLVQNLDEVFLASSTDGVGTLLTNKADLAFSDVFQSTTAFKTPALQPTGNGAAVGVVPFVFFKSESSPVTVTNIGPAQYGTLFANGQQDLMTFTGDSADAGLPIYLVGRNTLSGTRLTVEKCSKVPSTGLLYAPDGGCNWVLSPGFSSGSGVAGVFTGTCSDTPGVDPAALGYASLPDANTAVGGGAVIIAVEGEFCNTGTPAAPNFSPVTTGLYNLWGYEHLYNKSGASANVTTFRTQLKNKINTDLATSTSAIPLSAMLVSRPSDGGPISP